MFNNFELKEMYTEKIQQYLWFILFGIIRKTIENLWKFFHKNKNNYKHFREGENQSRFFFAFRKTGTVLFFI